MSSYSGPIPRTRPVQKRESVLRASILDTALELGIGSSNAVANWMFNPIGEVDEEAESTLSPSLTYSSTTTSDDSWLSYSSSLKGSFSNAPTTMEGSLLKPAISEGNVPLSQRTVQFDAIETQPKEPEIQDKSPSPPSHRKLRKPKPQNGHETDGGYISDGGAKEKKSKKKSKKSDKADGFATGEESDGGYLSEVLARRRQKKAMKEKEKQEKKDRKTAGEDDTDGGYMSTVSTKDKKSKKSPAAGDESDGGYLSESSQKRRRFNFRLNNKSRKKDSPDNSLHNIVPPVPSLPLMLPIAEKFSASMTDLTSENTSRAATPSASERPSTQRSSNETSLYPDSLSRGSYSGSISTQSDSPGALTTAFKDAESIRTPSTDVLRMFGRQALPHPPKSPLSTSIAISGTSTESQLSTPPSPNVPTLGNPKPRRNLSQKKVPPQLRLPPVASLSAETQNTLYSEPDASVPVTLTPPTPTPVTEPLRFRTRAATNPVRSDRSPSPAPPANYTTAKSAVIENTAASDVFTSPEGSNSRDRRPSDTQAIARPTALAKYDLPPPSPPPVGPLPRVPPVDGGSGVNMQIAVPTTVPSSPSSRPGTAPGRSLQPPTRSPGRPGTAPGSGSTPPVSLSGSLARSPSPSPSTSGTAPLFLQRIPSIQRGRESPFPAQPVISRKTSQVSLANNNQDQSSPQKSPASSGPHWNWAGQKRLDVHWKPRTENASGRGQEQDDEGQSSWVDFDDNSSSVSTRTSGNSSHPDIDSVLAALKDDKESEDVSELYSSWSDDDDSRYPDDEIDRSSRYSKLSADARGSILDPERSGRVRERFMQRVEQMFRDGSAERKAATTVPLSPSRLK